MVGDELRCEDKIGEDGDNVVWIEMSWVGGNGVG